MISGARIDTRCTITVFHEHEAAEGCARVCGEGDTDGTTYRVVPRIDLTAGPEGSGWVIEVIDPDGVFVFYL